MKLSTVVKAHRVAEERQADHTCHAPSQFGPCVECGKVPWEAEVVDDLGLLVPVVPAYVEPVVSPFTFKSSGIAERYEDGSAWGGFQDNWGAGR